MEKVVAVYTDGSLRGQNRKKIGAREGGTWAWCGVDARGCRIVEKYGLVLPDCRYEETKDGITNNQAEFYAACKALRDLPDGWSGTFYTDSMTIVARFRGAWKRRPMAHTPLAWQQWFWLRLRQMGAIEAVLVKGHPTDAELAQGFAIAGKPPKPFPVSEHNVWCDEACWKAN